MRLDNGVTTDPLLRTLVTLPTRSIGQAPAPKEVDNGLDDGCRLREAVCRRLGREASWKELSGRSTGRSRYQIADEWRLAGRCVWGWLRGVTLVPPKAESNSEATLISESPFGSPSSPVWQSGSWPAEEPASELSVAEVPRRGVVSVSEERLERMASDRGGWLPLAASQLVRTFPSPTRWWSSNSHPLVRARPRLTIFSERCALSAYRSFPTHGAGSVARGCPDGGSQPADERRSGAAPRRSLSRQRWLRTEARGAPCVRSGAHPLPPTQEGSPLDPKQKGICDPGPRWFWRRSGVVRGERLRPLVFGEGFPAEGAIATREAVVAAAARGGASDGAEGAALCCRPVWPPLLSAHRATHRL